MIKDIENGLIKLRDLRKIYPVWGGTILIVGYIWKSFSQSIT